MIYEGSMSGKQQPERKHVGVLHHQQYNGAEGVLKVPHQCSRMPETLDDMRVLDLTMPSFFTVMR
jgi:hypothetical protein